MPPHPEKSIFDWEQLCMWVYIYIYGKKQDLKLKFGVKILII